MKIAVSPTSIQNGVSGNSQSCPIAQELISLGFKNVAVGTSEAKVNGRSYPLPSEARVFIKRFDGRGATAVQPFEFDLPIQVG